MKRGEYLFLHIFSGKITEMCILDQNKVIILPQLARHVSFSEANLEAIYVSPPPLEQSVNTQISGFLL